MWLAPFPRLGNPGSAIAECPTFQTYFIHLSEIWIQILITLFSPNNTITFPPEKAYELQIAWNLHHFIVPKYTKELVTYVPVY